MYLRAVWSLARPSAQRIARFLEEERGLALTYPAAGTTRDEELLTEGALAGFVLDHNRQRLGAGAAAFEAAKTALRAWTMFPRPWTAIEPAPAPVVEGAVVAVLIHAMGAWWLNSARILYVIDEPRRFGFAYGTLPGHAERGEERFLVEQLEDESVWYDLRAFSRPRYWAARLGYPVTRALQRRFARESKAVMEAAVAAELGGEAAERKRARAEAGDTVNR